MKTEATSYLKSLSDCVQDAIRKKGWAYSTAADFCSISEDELRKIVKQSKDVQISTVAKISQGLDIPVEVLLTRQARPEPSKELYRTGQRDNKGSGRNPKGGGEMRDNLFRVSLPKLYPRKNVRRDIKNPDDVKKAYQKAFSQDKPCHAVAELLCDFADLLNVLHSFGGKERVECMAQEIEYIIRAWEELASSKRGGGEE